MLHDVRVPFQTLSHNQMLCHLPHTGIDYVVNLQNTSSRIFSVTFQPKQVNSTEHVIYLADDDIYEGTEYFRFRIHDIRFIGEAASIFTAQIVETTFAEVSIQDNDGEFRK